MAGTAPSARRATREGGRSTRASLLEAGRILFAEHGLAGVSVAQIAAAADVFPSQVTYYFGSKDALFVEAACRDVLLVATAVEEAGRSAGSEADYARGIVSAAITTPGLLGFVEAMLLARRRPELAPLIARTLDRLHAEGERAVIDTLVRRRWRIRTTPAAEARAFWATVLGVALEQAATGDAFDPATAEAAVLLVLDLHPGPDLPAARTQDPRTQDPDTRHTDTRQPDTRHTDTRQPDTPDGAL